MRRRGPKRNLGLVFYAVLYLAFLYLPVLFLPLFSFNDSAFIAFPLVGFTTKWYGQMLADSAMHTALWNSLKSARRWRWPRRRWAFWPPRR